MWQSGWQAAGHTWPLADSSCSPASEWWTLHQPAVAWWLPGDSGGGDSLWIGPASYDAPPQS